MKLLSGCPKSHETQRYQQFYVSYSMPMLGTKNEKSTFDSEICARFKKKMRKKFEQQLHLGQVAIGDVKFPSSYYKSRDEQPPVLIALLHIFNTPELNEAIFTILEKRITEKKKKV